MFSLLNRLKAVIGNGWTYHRFNALRDNGHRWSNGKESVSVYFTTGSGHHSGYMVDVTNNEEDGTLHLANGFIRDIDKALILADLYMSEDRPNPGAFMSTDRTNSDAAPGNMVRQDEWLKAHSYDYEFDVINPDKISK